MSSQYKQYLSYIYSIFPIYKLKKFVDAYGLGMLFTANVFGAGSVYILANTGAQFGFTLLWTLPLALFVDLGMHEMSGRLATIDKPLMEYILDVLGSTPAKLFAYTISFIMHFWAIANYAVAGAALSWLTPINNIYIGIILVSGLGIAFVELRVYDRIEAAISAIIMTVFSIYLVLLLGLNLPAYEVAKGLIPTLKTNVGFLAMVVSLLGTTVYYPNFFIQSSIKHEKEWSEMSPYRRDNFIGISFTVLISIAVIIVSALTLDPHTPTLTSPGSPLMSIIGGWALPTFVVAVFLASFSSATGTLFGAGFMVPQSQGKKTKFGDRSFRRIVELLIGMSMVFAILLLEFTDMTPVRLGIIMPAINGLVGLPATALALYFANKKFFDHPLWMRIGFAILVVLMFLMSILTAQSLYSQIIGWL